MKKIIFTFLTVIFFISCGYTVPKKYMSFHFDTKVSGIKLLREDKKNSERVIIGFKDFQGEEFVNFELGDFSKFSGKIGIVYIKSNGRLNDKYSSYYGTEYEMKGSIENIILENPKKKVKIYIDMKNGTAWVDNVENKFIVEEIKLKKIEKI
ncbi:hypothetical protein [Oceanivirga salmonicida]|uniref:hypothetical protein n=1 Tax=Oceanivirga salmonicida TaxID=1769291 RepID=UPI00083237F2|nr:hypothetical protein [Oceanivirga salmonicida]